MGGKWERREKKREREVGESGGREDETKGEEVGARGKRGGRKRTSGECQMGPQLHRHYP